MCEGQSALLLGAAAARLRRLALGPAPAPGVLLRQSKAALTLICVAPQLWVPISILL